MSTKPNPYHALDYLDASPKVDDVDAGRILRQAIVERDARIAALEAALFEVLALASNPGNEARIRFVARAARQGKRTA